MINERIELETLSLNPERLTARSGSARDERKREEGMTLRVKNLERLTKEVCVYGFVYVCMYVCMYTIRCEKNATLIVYGYVYG